MKFHQHKSNNMLLGAPKGMTNCETLPATMCVEEDGSVLIQSFWRPIPEELAALNQGASVVLTVFGNAHPAVSVGVTADTP